MIWDQTSVGTSEGSGEELDFIFNPYLVWGSDVVKCLKRNLACDTMCMARWDAGVGVHIGVDVGARMTPLFASNQGQIPGRQSTGQSPRWCRKGIPHLPIQDLTSTCRAQSPFQVCVSERGREREVSPEPLTLSQTLALSLRVSAPFQTNAFACASLSWIERGMR